MKLSRRELAAAALAPAAAAQAPSAPAGELEAARETVRRNAATLANIKVPMETEPAFQFEA